MNAMTLENLLEDRRAQFWALQIIGWTGWGVTFYIAAVLWGSPSEYAKYVPVITTVGLLLSLGLRWIYKTTWNLSIVRRMVIVVVASYLAGAAWKMSRF